MLLESLAGSSAPYIGSDTRQPIAAATPELSPRAKFFNISNGFLPASAGRAGLSTGHMENQPAQASQMPRERRICGVGKLR
jgi:hypothetical protein